jgi:phosphopantothenoylcysteine decarboxylase/phosphopantothenate--cysteine ligase
MTASAQRFVGAVTFSGITGHPVATDMWDAGFAGEMHVALADSADALLIVPATADVLSRLAHGRADDLLTATALCARGPVLLAPAMHPRMWEHPATLQNVNELKRQGRVTLVGPVVGPVASGDVGMGRLEDPERIVAALEAALSPRADLEGRHVVVAAGPTFEAVDPVRFLGNRSSGRMGFAIANAAARRGARVSLVAGPVSLPTPPGAERIDVESAEQMQQALLHVLRADLSGADIVVMAAAVADFRVANISSQKLKKSDGVASLALTPNPDLLADLGARRLGAKKPLLVGFALETGDDASVLAYASGKLAAKRVDMIVANAAHASLGRETNRISLVTNSGATSFLSGPKEKLADQILDAALGLI